jgi:hypothetical protein
MKGRKNPKSLKPRLTSSVTGPDDGVASPRPFVGVPLLHPFILNSVARSGARGVRGPQTKHCLFVWMFAIILLQISCCPAKPTRGTALPDATEPNLVAMSPYVSQVVTGGRWQEGGHNGQYRMVASCGGWEHVRCEFFLQWVQDPEDQGKDPIVIAMIPVPEATNRMAFKAQLAITERAVLPCIITVTSETEHEEIPFVIAIKPAGIGKYVVQSMGAQ